MKTSSIIAAAIVVAFIGYWLMIYNNVVAMQKNVQDSWAQIQLIYKNRAAATPKLLTMVNTQINAENETMDNVNKALKTVLQLPQMNLPTSTEQLQQFDQAQQSLSQALTQVMLLAAKQPNLNGDPSFLSLQITFAGYENQATIERQRYQLVTKNYNSYISDFPNNIIAAYLDYAKVPYFSEEDATNVSPVVNTSS